MKIRRAYLRISIEEDRLSDLAAWAVEQETQFDFEGVLYVLEKTQKTQSDSVVIEKLLVSFLFPLQHFLEIFSFLLLDFHQ